MESVDKHQHWKQSTSDLQSRLKTRKVLGVGETDDGDVHRSKLSQILGHSDQLYIRLPWALRAWQLLMATFLTGTGLCALVFPESVIQVHSDDEAKLVAVPVRFYGSAVLAFSIFHWSTWYSKDREVIRIALLSSIVFFLLQTVASMLSTVPIQEMWLLSPETCNGFRIGAATITVCFYWAQ
ncbi:tumor protein p53-inducible protein 11-like [Babylonia areolata]|uniref:tumor protein p53-inducible protein 11-like n=1 Tax=Babylonia areolata TaxID=304850 RepID=UPI003FD2B913